MSALIFMAFIMVYAVLVLSHKENPRAYRMFWFGLLVSVMYGSIYSYYADMYLVFILMLTSLAILTQYFHIKAVESGRVKPTKMLVDVANTGFQSVQKGTASARKSSRSRRRR